MKNESPPLNDPAIIRRWQHTTSSTEKSYTLLPGDKLAIGQDKNIELRNINSGQLLQTLRGHSRSVTALATISSGDGKIYLASSSDDKTIRIWDISNGQCLRTLQGHTSSVEALITIPSNDGKIYLASGSHDDTIRIWDISNGQCLRTLQGHTSSVEALTTLPSSDGKTLLVSSGWDEIIRIWDCSNGRCLHTLQGHTSSVEALTTLPSSDGKTLLASGGLDNTIRIWDYSNEQCLHTLQGHTQGVMALSPLFANSRLYLASGGWDKTIYLWDTSTWQCEQIIYASHTVYSLLTSQHSQLISGTFKETIIWHLPWLLQNCSVTHLELCAQQGIVDAQVRLAKFYKKGIGTISSNRSKVFTWYERAAQSGDANAQRKIAAYYEKGKGVNKDWEQALNTYYAAMKKTPDSSRLFRYLHEVKELHDSLSPYYHEKSLSPLPSDETRYAYLGPQMGQDKEAYLFQLLAKRSEEDRMDVMPSEYIWRYLEETYQHKRHMTFWVECFVCYLEPLEITHLALAPDLTEADWYAINWLLEKNLTICKLSIKPIVDIHRATAAETLVPAQKYIPAIYQASIANSLNRNRQARKLPPLSYTTPTIEKTFPDSDTLQLSTLSKALPASDSSIKEFLSGWVAAIYSGQLCNRNADTIQQAIATHPAFEDLDKPVAAPEILQLKFLYLCVSEVYLQQRCTGFGCRFGTPVSLQAPHSILDHLIALFFYWANARYPEVRLAELKGKASDYEQLSYFLRFLFEHNKAEARANNMPLASMVATIAPFMKSASGKLAYDICGADNYLYAGLQQKELPPYVRLGGVLSMPYFSLDCRHFDMRGADLHDARCYSGEYHRASHAFVTPPNAELLKYHANFAHADLRFANLSNTRMHLPEALQNARLENARLAGSNINDLLQGKVLTMSESTPRQQSDSSCNVM